MPLKHRVRRPHEGTQTTAHRAAIGLLLSAACAQREPDARSDFVDLYLDPGIHVCAGQLASYDAFITRVFELWNASPVPEDFHVSVHARRRPRCDGHSCATPGNTWLYGDLGQYHELTHVVHFALDGESVPALKEGMAESLGPLAGIAASQSGLASLERDFLYKPSIDAAEYAQAALFTRYLVDRYGVSRFRNYFRTMGADDAPLASDFDVAFEASFGEPLDAAWPEYKSAARCAYDFWFCSGTDSVGLPYEFNGIDCANSSTLGFDASSIHWEENPYSPTAIVRFKNDADRNVRIGLEYGFVYLSRCGSCEEQANVPAHLLSSDDSSDNSEEVLLMPAGDYAFILRAVAGGETRLTLRAED